MAPSPASKVMKSMGLPRIVEVIFLATRKPVQLGQAPIMDRA